MSIDPLMTKKEAASYLRTSTRTIDDYRKRGLLNACKIGKKVLFRQSELIKSVKSESNG